MPSKKPEEDGDDEKDTTSEPAPDEGDDEDDDSDASVESVGAEDALEEVPDRARKQRKQYRIQEVIKRRQILLVQVVKEERGNKGAALTTYLSLARSLLGPHAEHRPRRPAFPERSPMCRTANG